MEHFQKNTVVWQWANSVKNIGDIGVDPILAHIRSRRDMPHRFPNKAQMLAYLVRTGMPQVEEFSLDVTWASYRAYNDSVSRPSSGKKTENPYELMTASRNEARRRGATTFTGEPCHKGHGTLRRTNNGACVVCQREYVKDWQRRRRGKVLRELSEPTEDELQMFKAALVKTPRRA